MNAHNVASSDVLPQRTAPQASKADPRLRLAGQTNSGYKYSAPDGSYTVQFPGKPTETSQTVQTNLGPIKVLLVSCETDHGKRAYFASSTQYHVDPHRYNVEKGLDGARDGIAKKTNGTISNETKINYKGASGRQMYLTVKQGKAKVRIYVVNAGKGPTLYQTFVMDTNGKPDNAEANAFLDSLTFKPH
jgi:hypothetical protein